MMYVLDHIAEYQHSQGRPRAIGVLELRIHMLPSKRLVVQQAVCPLPSWKVLERLQMDDIGRSRAFGKDKINARVVILAQINGQV